MYLIAEYCRGPFYMGWHLYLRENRWSQPNANGEWGWIRRPRENSAIVDFLASIGITISEDGTCDDDGIAKFAERFKINGRRIGGKKRGGVEVKIGEFGKIEQG